MKVRVLFVCLGNICRSPTAEAVFREVVSEEGLEDRVEIDSAGTGSWHIGEEPDARTQQAALHRGIDMSAQRARQVTRIDFHDFDYLLAMDAANLDALERLQPSDHGAELALFMQFAPDGHPQEVPDPYYGGPQGFDVVLDMVEHASRGLVEHIRTAHPGNTGK